MVIPSLEPFCTAACIEETAHSAPEAGISSPTPGTPEVLTPLRTRLRAVKVREGLLKNV